MKRNRNFLRAVLLLDIFLKKSRAIITNQRTWLCFAIVLLCVISLYTAYSATRTYTGTNGDELANTYMVSDGWERNGFTVLDIHTNLLKMPILFIQAKLGMNMSSFIVINALLVLLANLLWAWLMSKVMKGWQLTFSILVMSSFQLGSILLSINYVFKSFRNIEIAIIGLLVYLLATQLRKPSLQKMLIFLIAYALILSGDAYYQYTVSLPLLVLLSVLWLRRVITSRVMTLLSLSVLGASVAAILLNKVIAAIGLFNIVFGYQGKTYIVSYDNLGQQLTLAGREVFRMFGADFFGQVLGRSVLGSLVNALLLALAIVGAVAVIKHLGGVSRTSGQAEQVKLFMFSMGTLIPLFTFLIYIFSGQARPDSESARYLILIPFWAILPLAFIIPRITALRSSAYPIACLAIVFGIFLNAPVIQSHYDSLRIDSRENQAYYRSIGEILKKERTEIVVAGHWTATPIRFWNTSSTSKGLRATSVQNCHQALPFLVRQAWYRTSPAAHTTRSALIIDRAKDPVAWNCSDSQITEHYGIPGKVIEVPNPIAERMGEAYGYTQVWIYSYDVRSKIVQ